MTGEGAIGVGTCSDCGAPLPSVGRFCVNCGARIGSGGAAAAPVAPPHPAPTAPPPVPERAAGREMPSTGRRDDPFWLLADAPREPERGPVALPVLGIVVALVLVAVVGVFLLSRGVTEEQDGQPDSGGEPRGRAAAGGRELRDRAFVTAPASAAPGIDIGGGTITFEPEQMLDGQPGTAWRMPGDGTGEVIRFRFRRPVLVTRVGLVNGYAKRVRRDGRTVDWYHGNRRITRVRWSFDSGDPVRQRLRDSLGVQTRRVPGVSTRTVRLRLVRVTEPGTGADARDYTAISDVSLVGRPSAG